MEGQLSKDVFQQIYDTLNSVNHVPYDCGTLCEKACCQRINPDMGIYLLPNEHLVLQGETDWLTWEEHLAQNYDFPASWQGPTYFLNCNGNCPREKRPIQCRTFPLAPYLSPTGQLMLIWETLDLPYSCPLLTKKEPLDKEFISALFKVWQTLITDPLIRDLIEYDSRSREAENSLIEPVFR